MHDTGIVVDTMLLKVQDEVANPLEYALVVTLDLPSLGETHDFQNLNPRSWPAGGCRAQCFAVCGASAAAYVSNYSFLV